MAVETQQFAYRYSFQLLVVLRAVTVLIVLRALHYNTKGVKQLYF